MKNSDNRPDSPANVERAKPEWNARLPRTVRRFKVVPRLFLLAAILVASLLVVYIPRSGSTTAQAGAGAKQEAGLDPEATPTEANPGSAGKSGGTTAVLSEGGGRVNVAAARSGESLPSADVAATTAFTVEDPNAYVYTVRMAEFWFLIADRFDLSSDLLKEANGELWQLRGEEIQVGDQMRIPGLGADAMISPLVHAVEPGDSWERVADRFSVTFLDLLVDNLDLWAQRGIHLQAGDRITVTLLPPDLARKAVRLGGPGESAAPRPGGGLAFRTGASARRDWRGAAERALIPAGAYRVQAGDTWESIAAATGIDIQALKEVNPALRDRALQAGDIVRVSWMVQVTLMTRPSRSGNSRSASDLDSLSQEERAALAERGLVVYKEQYCGICHQLDSAGTRGTFGPSHNGMASLAAARLDDPAYNGTATDVYSYLYESIIEPDVYNVEGFEMSLHRMPSYRHIPEDDLEALLVFLAGQ